MKVLALDLSTSTGWSLFDKLTPLEYGTLEKVETRDYKQEIRSWKDYPDSYPMNLMETAAKVAKMCGDLFEEYEPDVVVIEEINKGRARISQKLLGFIQMAVADILISRGATVKYLTTECWRNMTNCRQSKDEKNWNAKIARMKKKRKEDLAKLVKSKEMTKVEARKLEILPVKIDGKVAGKKGQKDYALRRVQEIFGFELRKKDNDAADALLLGITGAIAYGGETKPENLL